MESQTGFILKVLLLSAGLSILIKFIGPSLSIPATPVTALIGILTPSLIMAIAFLGRVYLHRQNQQAR